VLRSSRRSSARATTKERRAGRNLRWLARARRATGARALVDELPGEPLLPVDDREPVCLEVGGPRLLPPQLLSLVHERTEHLPDAGARLVRGDGDCGHRVCQNSAANPAPIDTHEATTTITPTGFIMTRSMDRDVPFATSREAGIRPPQRSRLVRPSRGRLQIVRPDESDPFPRRMRSLPTPGDSRCCHPEGGDPNAAEPEPESRYAGPRRRGASRPRRRGRRDAGRRRLGRGPPGVEPRRRPVAGRGRARGDGRRRRRHGRARACGRRTRRPAGNRPQCHAAEARQHDPAQDGAHARRRDRRGGADRPRRGRRDLDRGRRGGGRAVSPRWPARRRTSASSATRSGAASAGSPASTASRRTASPRSSSSPPTGASSAPTARTSPISSGRSAEAGAASAS
jgi:hypothetical protein